MYIFGNSNLLVFLLLLLLIVLLFYSSFLLLYFFHCYYFRIWHPFKCVFRKLSVILHFFLHIKYYIPEVSSQQDAFSEVLLCLVTEHYDIRVCTSVFNIIKKVFVLNVAITIVSGLKASLGYAS